MKHEVEVDVAGLGEDVKETGGGGRGVRESVATIVVDREVGQEVVNDMPGEREQHGHLEEALSEVDGHDGER
jgi:hypothetical protein